MSLNSISLNFSPLVMRLDGIHFFVKYRVFTPAIPSNIPNVISTGETLRSFLKVVCMPSSDAGSVWSQCISGLHLSALLVPSTFAQPYRSF